MLALVACGRTSGTAPAPPSDDEARARALLAQDAPLPPRAEVVALADAVAVAASRGSGATAQRTARLAADLRARSWRFDHAPADAHEAAELYAVALKSLPGTDEACDADRARAVLAGAVAADATALYRELYLARRRQVALRDASAAPSSCIEAMDRALASLVAFRPGGDALRALELEGNAAAEQAARGPISGAPTPRPSVTSSAVAAPGGSARELVVVPGEELIGKGPVRITSVERYLGEEGGRLVVNVSAPATFSVGTLAADDSSGKDARVYVDLPRASAKGLSRETEVGGLVRRVRLGAQEGGGTRVVLDLARPAFRRIYWLPDPFRIVVDLSTRPPSRVEGPGDKREVRRVAIDAGHGGVDAGAVGPTGLREKDVTLDIAHRVAPVLSHELKIETLLTRDNDSFVPLDERAARANAFHADLFVSIHCNSAENGQARGVATFSLDQVRDPEGFALRVAARENATKGDRPKDPGALDAQVARLASSLDVSGVTARSHHFAELVQRGALASLGSRWPDTKDQGVRSAGFFVLVGAEMPAVLFETSFISNPDDESRLATADYRQKLADGIVNAIRAWREGK